MTFITGLGLRIFILYVFVMVAFFFVGCQHPPTRVYTDHKIDIGPIVSGAKRPLVIDENTVVVDTRSTFAYTLAHFPRAINLDWMFFSDPAVKYKGVLKKDLYSEARSLARKGISPDSKIIVVGDNYTPFAGRMAWILFYLGIKNVQFADLQYFEGPYVNKEAKPYPSVSVWKPKYRKSLYVSKAEVRRAVNQSASTNPIRLIDVRSKEEFFKKKSQTGRYKEPDLRAIHIPWKEFLDRNGRAKMSMARKLLAIGLKKSDRIIVLSQNGVRSAAVTMALLSLGFSKAGNYSAGLEELFYSPW